MSQHHDIEEGIQQILRSHLVLNCEIRQNSRDSGREIEVKFTAVERGVDRNKYIARPDTEQTRREIEEERWQREVRGSMEYVNVYDAYLNSHSKMTRREAEQQPFRYKIKDGPCLEQMHKVMPLSAQAIKATMDEVLLETYKNPRLGKPFLHGVETVELVNGASRLPQVEIRPGVYNWPPASIDIQVNIAQPMTLDRIEFTCVIEIPYRSTTPPRQTNTRLKT